MDLIQRIWMGVAAFAAVILVAGGCASTPSTLSRSAPDADFSQYSTFGFRWFR